MTRNADVSADGDRAASMSRRGFFRAGAAGAAVAAGVAAGSGTAVAQYDGWLEGVSNYDGTHDYRGQDEVTVEVGAGENGLRFGPAAILIDPGATVVWEWTGAGGGHNVVADDGTFDSGSAVAEEGTTFEHTFEDAGDGDSFNYYCGPHQSVGMKGVVAVGSVDDDLVDPQAEGGDGGDGGSGGPAGYGDWFENVGNYEGTRDLRGQSEVTVSVGAGENGLLFDPPAILVDPGTTVVWEWTGAGGGHNVVEENDVFSSGEPVAEEGTTFEYTFADASDGDVFRYACGPHQSVGMKGAVAVGSVDDDLIGGESGGSGGGSGLSASDIGTLALGFGFAGALLVPLFYAAHQKAGRNA
ncbi:halocyanin domain protein [Halorubrum californiense DSM 19288]|uniref:Halocyanin domain protein n=1 Tax=Halorubrum californiense DSM 19288 TaxID=1227465 RepID=M0E994_9EURY|nr:MULTISPECIES: halocyanin domain-containing protein [Halorubrum]ELZ44376.1 halocyanin domain protein [Halorubrum californiense DSM 19288]TKX67700.1 halocyanin domain-containing protein [Halorubrum sp. GN11GM_10-3_MGM]